ncbi:hypothetical protein ABZ707_03685 [Streptomyces sp. NPDC006923]|uniref:hypothetical protein n=1 Tax=Streptomyces sp. NPDC006923 TaxID=3155355 RepID=UPI0033D4A3C1
MTVPLPEPTPTDCLGVLIAAYDYKMGSCFRCPRKGTRVTSFGEISSAEGVTPLYACRECVQELLTMHDRQMERMDTPLRMIQLPRSPRGAEAT